MLRYYSLAAFTFSCVVFAAPAGRPAVPVQRDLHQLPMSFEENRGQAPSSTLFVSRAPGYSVEFARQAVRIHAGRSTVTMRMVGSNRTAVVEGADPQPGVTNYLFGSNPQDWITHVPHYGQVRYRDVYPGIDLAFYGNGRQFEYDWFVRPGGDPNRIRTKFHGIRNMRIDSQDDLVLDLGGAEMKWRKPLLYQDIAGVKTAVDGSFEVIGRNLVGFTVRAYDLTKPLVIDPILAYATFLGGSNYDQAHSLAVNAQTGDAYVVGFTSSSNFPLRNNRFQNYGSIGFIAKINTSGTQNLATTFIAGTDASTPQTTNVTAVAVDPLGFVYVAGIAGGNSNAVPFTSNAFQKTLNGTQNGWVAKLPSDLSSILYCSWLGGNGSDSVADGSNGIAVDAAQNLYVAGTTTSSAQSASNPKGFYVTPNALQKQNNGTSNAFLVKIDMTGSTRLYSTFLGGSGQDVAFGVGVGPQQQMYITGFTRSCNFPTTDGTLGTFKAYQTTHGGICSGQIADNDDVFVTVFKADGSNYIFSTLLGGDSEDVGRAIYVDSQGNAYITGDTESPTFGPTDTRCPQRCQPYPTTSNAFQPVAPRCAQNSTCYGGESDALITELSPTGALLYSTYYGGKNGIFPGCLTYLYNPLHVGCGLDAGRGIVVQETGTDAGSIYIAGATTSSDFPMANAIQPKNAGGFDSFVVKIKPGSQPLFSTYFGGVGEDYAYTLAHDAQNNVYAAGWVSPSDYNVATVFPPAEAPPLYPFLGGTNAFLFKLSNADLSVVSNGFRIPVSTGAIHTLTAGGNFTYSGDLEYNASSGNSGASAADNPRITGLLTGPATVDKCTPSMGACDFAMTSLGTQIVVSGVSRLPRSSAIHLTIDGHLSSANVGDQIQFQLTGSSNTNDLNLLNNSAGSGFRVPATSCNQLIVTSNTTTFSAAGGTGSFDVNSPCGWGWSGGTLASWIHPPDSGNGSGTFQFTVDPYSGTTVQSADILIGGQRLTITQNPIVGNPTPHDFDGNKVPDLVWMNNVTRQVNVNYFGGTSGASLIGWSYLYQAGAPGWKVAAVADFDRNGIPDLVWVNDATKTVNIDYYGGPGGASLIGFNVLYNYSTAGWHIVGAGDFNGGGVPALVWQNDTTNQVNVNYFGGAGGATPMGFNVLYPAGTAPGWRVAAVADFNGDEVPDILWQNTTTGQVNVNYLGGPGGASITGFNVLYGPGAAPGWHVIGALDLDNNGTADVLWENDTTGQVNVNYFSATGLIGWSILYPPGSTAGWTLIN